VEDFKDSHNDNQMHNETEKFGDTNNDDIR
jgi:hypothetical protein